MLILRSIILQLFLVVRADAIFRPIIPRLGCFLRFGLFRFDLDYFDQYDRYFHGDSVMTYAKTGVYQGASSIEEYVRFADESSPYFATSGAANTETKFDGYDRRNKLCNFFVLYDSFYTMEPNLTSSSGNETIRVATMVRLQFNYRKRYIPRINVQYTDAWMEYYFGTLLNSDATREYVCSVYEGNSCSSFLDTPDDCLSELSALPTLTNVSYADGNSQGCRAIHAAFADTNDVHCPHISFEPMMDSSGQTKCQTSDNFVPLDFFSENDLATFDDYMVKRGFDPDLGFYVE